MTSSSFQLVNVLREMASPWSACRLREMLVLQSVPVKQTRFWPHVGKVGFVQAISKPLHCVLLMRRLVSVVLSGEYIPLHSAVGWMLPIHIRSFERNGSAQGNDTWGLGFLGSYDQYRY